jgi:hypothetical protein
VPRLSHTDTLRAYARIGAMKRLEELRQEEASIRAAFPELFRGRGRGAAPATARAAASSGTSNDEPRRRRSWKMSAAQKRAVSERMRKYWAARRKAKNG